MRLAFLIGALAVAGMPAAGAQEMHRMSMGAADSIRMPEGRTTITVPFRRSGEHILIPVGVNGNAPVWVVLDTGMPGPGVLFYDGPAVSALALEYMPVQAQVGGAGGSGESIQARIAAGATLRIGEAEIWNAMVTVLPPVAFLSAIHNGIIGAGVFKNFVVAIDHDRGEITLTLPERYRPPNHAATVPMILDGRVAYVDAGLVSAAGTVSPLRLIVDLGASHPVSLNATTDPAIQIPRDALTTRIGRGMSGEVRGRVGRIPGLELGGIRLTNVIATFPNPDHENPRGLDSRNGNLGSGVLGRFNITFDYPHQKIHLVRNQRFAAPFEWDMSGLVLEPGPGDTLSVAQVVPGSPAALAGVAGGDRIVAIGGHAVTNRDLPDTREWLRKDAAEVELRTVRDGVQRTGKLRLRRMI